MNIRLAQFRTAHAILVMATLAIAIAATTTAFSIVNGALKPIRLENIDRIVNLVPIRERGPQTHRALNSELLHRIRDIAPSSLELLVGVGGDQVTLSSEDSSHVESVEVVDGPYFELFQTRPILGRILVPADAQPESCCAAVISESLWKRRFQSDSGILGKLIQIRRRAYSIVGVVPDSFRGVRLPQLFRTDAWVLQNSIANYSNLPMQVYGRLRADASVAEAGSEMRTLGPAIYPEERDLTLDVRAAWRGMIPEPLIPIAVAAASLGLMVCGAILLLGATTAISLSRATLLSRRSEFALRIALGASQADLNKQALIEAATLTIPSAIAGALLALVIVRTCDVGILFPSAGAMSPHVDALPDAGVLGFVVLAFSLVTLMLSRAEAGTAYANPSLLTGGAVKASNGFIDKASRSRIGMWQIAMTTALLIVSGLLLRASAGRVQSTVAKLPDHVVVGHVAFDGTEFDMGFATRLMATLDRDGQSEGFRASMVTSLPLPRNTGIQRAGIGFRANAGPSAFVQVIGTAGDFTSTLGMSMVEGVEPTTDRPIKRGSAVVDEKLAKKLWPNERALGRRLWLASSDHPLQVDGVVRVRGGEGAAEVDQYIFVPLETERASDLEILLAGKGTDAVLIETLRRVVTGSDPTVPMVTPQPLRTYADATARIAASILVPAVTAAGLALLMSLVGVYAVTRYNASTRSSEFGIRLALGAPAEKIYFLVLGECLGVVCRGALIGVVVAAAVSVILPSRFTLALRPDDWIFVALIPAATFVVVMLAAIPAARRANKSDPLAIMRSN